MKINKKEILKVLEATKPGLSNKEIIAFTNTFYFTGTDIITFNDEICIRYPFETEFTGVVIAEKLISVLNKMGTDKEGFIEYEYTDSELIFKNKKASYGIILNSEGTLQLDEINIEDKKWSKLPDNFITGSKLSVFCCSNDQSMPSLTCLNYTNKTIQATNRFRAFEFNLSSKIDTPFLLPSFVINTLSKYDIKKYVVDSAWVHFKTNNEVVLSIRSFPEGEFPDISNFFKVKGNDFTFPDKINELLDKSLVFIEGITESDKMVNIKIKGKKLLISSKSTEGWFKESIICEKYPNEINMEISPIFLKDILKETKGCKICLEPNQSMLFKAVDWQHVLSIAIND